MKNLLLVLLALIAALPAQAQDAQEKDALRNAPPYDLRLTPGVYPTRWAIVEVPWLDPVLWADGGGECHKTASQSLKGKPQFVSVAPIYGRLVFYTSQEHKDVASSWLFALDESKGSAKGYDTLYLDVNANSDLSDDPASTGKPYQWPAGRQKFYPGVTAVSFEPAAELPYNKLHPNSKNGNLAAIDAIFIADANQSGLMARVRGAWTGEVDSNKGKIPFRLTDGNDNQRFSDRRPYIDSNGFISSDKAVFDWNRLGRFGTPDLVAGGGFEGDEVVELTPANNIAGRLYTIQPDENGASLRIAAYTGPYATCIIQPTSIGRVVLDNPVITATGASADFGFQQLGVPGSLELPVDTYDIFGWFRGKDGNDVYQVGYEVNKSLREAGRTVSLPVGGSISMTIGPEPKVIRLKGGGWNRTELRLRLSSGGYVDFSGGSAKRPQVVLKNAAGKIVDTATTPSGQARWLLRFPKVEDRAKPLAAGKYTIEAVFDTAPFGGVLRAKMPAIVEKPAKTPDSGLGSAVRPKLSHAD